MEQTYSAEGAAPPVGESAKAAAERAREEGRRIIETVKSDAVQAVEERKSAAATYLSDLSSAIHRGSEELRQKGREGSASLVDAVAEELDRMGGRVGRTGVQEMWSDFEDLAHRRPGLLFGAAILAGFGAARFAMSARRPPHSGAPRSQQPKGA